MGRVLESPEGVGFTSLNRWERREQATCEIGLIWEATMMRLVHT